MAYDEEGIRDAFWYALKAQAKRADYKKLFSIVDEEHVRQITVTLRRPKSTSARVTRIEVKLSRNAIEIMGYVDLEFDLRDDELVGLKYKGESVNPSQAAEKVLELLFRMAREA
jgi:hypothetical protein